MLILMFIAVVLMIATYTDITAHQIPNWLTYPGIILAVVIHFIDPKEPWWFYLIGLVPAIAMILLNMKEKQFGWGDVKLAACFGIALGGAAPLLIFGISFIFMLLFHVVKAFVPTKSKGMPMGPFFLLSYFVVLLLNHSVIDLML